MEEFCRLSDCIFKLTDKTTARNIKYVFVGPVSSKIEAHLQILSKRGVKGVSDTGYFDLVKRFGVDWEFTLGLYDFHTLSGLANPSDKKLKSTSKAPSLTEFRKLRDPSPAVINQARSVYSKELLKDYSSKRADEIKFVTMFYLRLDDDIKTIKRKICVSIEHIDYYALPEWQYLWIAEQKLILGHAILDKQAHDAEVQPQSDPVADIVNLLSGKVDEVSRRIHDRTYRIQKLNDTILHDYLPIPKYEIDLFLLPSFLVRIKPVVQKLPGGLQNPLELQRSFLRKFFPDADKTEVLKILSDSRYDLVSESKALVGDMMTALRYETDANRFMETCRPMTPVEAHLQSVTAEVVSHRDEDESGLDLERLFNGLRVDRSLMFISYKGGKKLRDGVTTKYKLKKDISFLQNHMKDIRSWFNPLDEARKTNTLTLRFRFTELEDSTTSLVIHENGDYKIHSSWPFAAKSDIKFFSATLGRLVGYIDAIRSMDVRVDRDSTFLLQRPSLCFRKDETCQTNVMIKHMTHRFVFACDRPFKYESFRQLAACSSSYLELSTEQADINKFWKRTARYTTVIQKLQSLGLYSVASLVNLTNAQWNALDLVSNAKANTPLVEDFRRYVLSLTSNKITFYYKKHSRYETLTAQKKIITDFMNEYRVSFKDIIIDNDLRTALYIELRKKLQLTKKEVFAVFNDYQDVQDMQARGGARGPSGVRCDVSMMSPTEYRLTVHGIRNFTQRSSISYLLKSIACCFSRIFCRYSSPDLSTILRDNKHLWAPASIVSIQSQTERESIDDLDDIDLEDLEWEDVDEEVPSGPVIVSDRVTTLHEDDNDIDAETDDTLTDTTATTSGKGSYHLARLQSRDPYLFTPNPRWKHSFATKCQKSNHKQPIILTDDEYARQDKSAFKIPKGTPDGFRYRDHYFICPEIWCPRLGKALHPHELAEQVWSNSDLNYKGEPVPKIISGICPDGEKAIIANDGIGGWKAKNISDKDPNQGRMEFPAFLTDLHPDGIGVPCCFQNDKSIGKDSVSFFQLLSGGTDVRKRTMPVESSQRYRLRATNFPLPDYRFGDLTLELDNFFNESPPEDPEQRKIYHDGYSRYLRMGVYQGDGSSFLACMTRVFDTVSDINPNIGSAKAFKAYISEKLNDRDLFCSLNNGTLKVIFQDFQNDDAMARFRQYLEMTQDVDKEYVWDLLSRPIPWLFPEGINIFVLKGDSKGKISLKLPSKVDTEELYHADRDSVFLFTDGVTYEPVVMVDNHLKIHPIMPFSFVKRKIWSYLQSLQHASSFMYGKRLYICLMDLPQRELNPTIQYVNAYNRIVYLGLKNGMLVPTDGMSGPIWGPNINLITKTKVEPCTCRTVIDHLPKLSKLLKTKLVIQAVLPNSDGRPSALKLENGLIIPVSDATKCVKQFPMIMDDVHIQDVDQLIYHGTIVEDERTRQMRHHHLISNTLHRLQAELTARLHRELRQAPKNSGPLFWFKIYNILHGIDEDGYALPVKHKIRLLKDLFMRPNDGLLRQIVTTNKEKSAQDNQFSVQNGYSICSEPVGLTQLPCDMRSHCAWTPQGRVTSALQTQKTASKSGSAKNGKCKLFIPAKYFETFASILIEDIVRNNVGREMVLENRIQTLLHTDKIKVGTDQISLDDDVVPYLLYLLEHFNLRNLRQKVLYDAKSSKPQSRTEDVRSMKEHLIYDGLTNPIFAQIEASHASLKDLPTPWKAKFPQCGLLQANPFDANDVLAYILSCVLDNTLFTKHQLRQDIVTALSRNMRKNSTPLWKQYLDCARPFLKNLPKISTFDALSRSLLRGQVPPNLGDLFIAAQMYPITIRVLRAKKILVFGNTVLTQKNVLAIILNDDTVGFLANRSRPPPGCFFHDVKR